jgi:hypothetical protein
MRKKEALGDTLLRQKLKGRRTRTGKTSNSAGKKDGNKVNKPLGDTSLSKFMKESYKYDSIKSYSDLK